MNDTRAGFLQATRSSYDAIAKEYTAEHPSSLTYPLDQALVASFVRLVVANGPEPVADVGSGPGYVTAYLHELGVPAFGVDVSPEMVALARGAHPQLRFHVGSMTALDLPDGTLGGILALYSTIHVPDAQLPAVFAGFRRTLVPGGHVLLAFQTRTDTGHLHLTERFGHAIDLDYYWRTPEQMAGLLSEAGLTPVATILREPQEDERRARGFVLARK
ncbi:class I SAM-dependent methyltransferase [Streptomyces sp. NPDC005435]|uniref:class I SAM-dependent DNA methyltransferase n=1 Tax=Streptomyces sp. NPDC005435 TaxID=3154464 RepID=UPI003452843B